MTLKDLLKGVITEKEYCNYHNIEIIYAPIPYPNIRGFVEYYNDIYFVYINKNMSYYKKKKTILHELAHIELNQLCQYDKDLFALKVDKYEDDADAYIKLLEEEF